MTATTTLTATTAPTAPIAAPHHPPARFGDLVAAEWTKLWSLRSTSWMLGLTALAIVALNVNAAVADLQFFPFPAGTNEADLAMASLGKAFTTNAALMLMIAAGSVGGGMVVSELSSGLIRTTFVAVPARRAVMAAKAVVATAVFLVYGAVVAGVSFGLTQAILASEDAGFSISYPGAWRIVVASALLAPIAALVGMAVGAVVRHTATTMVTTPFLLIVLPIFLAEDRHLSATIRHTMLEPAWLRLVEVVDRGFRGDHPWTAVGAGTVMAAWFVVAAALAVTVLHRRDV